MSRDAAVVAVVISLMVGYYWARWRRAEITQKGTKAVADAADKQAWKARGVMVLVGFAVVAVIDMWLRGKGR